MHSTAAASHQSYLRRSRRTRPRGAARRLCRWRAHRRCHRTRMPPPLGEFSSHAEQWAPPACGSLRSQPDRIPFNKQKLNERPQTRNLEAQAQQLAGGRTKRFYERPPMDFALRSGETMTKPNDTKYVVIYEDCRNPYAPKHWVIAALDKSAPVPSQGAQIKSERVADEYP